MSARNKFDVDEKLTRSFNLKMIARSMVYIKKQKHLFLQAIFLQTAAVLAGLCEPRLTAYALDFCIPQKNIPQLVLCSLLFCCCVTINVTLITKATKATNIIGQNIIHDIRKDLYDHLQKLSFSYYESRPHGKILVRVINYVNSVSNILSNGLINTLLQLINLIFITAFMFAMDVRLSLMVLAGLPFALAIILILKPMQRKGWQLYSNKSSNMNAYLNESINCMKITQLFARENYNIEIYKNLIREAKAAWFKAVFSSNAVGPLIDLVSKIVIVAMLIVGIYIANPMISFGILLAMIQYCNRFWQPINQLANIYNNFINNIAYLERIFETIDEPIEVSDKEDSINLPPIRGDVEFRNVKFCYDEEHAVLKNLSFRVKAGESIALVGPTGSGKSTIINLICRFYNVTSGQVLIDGYDVSSVTLKSLRSQMGIMMQDSFIFSDTIHENIRYGKLNATDEDIRAAAELVSIDQFIENLPNQYETVLPERGASLSQGQKQLISFARTMVSDPKILILDEATSSIDTFTEQQMQEALNHSLKGRTSFIVAHRLSTIRSCDKIMYILNGEIAECGTHDELMSLKGLYYQMHQTE